MSILVTAFDTYDTWQENSSWTALTEYLKEYGVAPDVITRRYPVDLQSMRNRLELDLARGISGVIHLGQRPGAATLNLEAICLNLDGSNALPRAELEPLIDGAPIAFRTACPLSIWNERLRRAGVPSDISYHAGTYLCNAMMYLSHAWFAVRGLDVPVAFVHTPLTPTEADRYGGKYSAMDPKILAEGVRILIDSMRAIVTSRVVS
jgi:pyroglutamyl-peptidase